MAVREVNKMPVLTWNWLKMNGESVEIPDEVTESEPITLKVDGAFVDSCRSEGGATELPFEFENEARTVGKINISVDEDINHTIIMDFKSENGGFGSVETDISLSKKARLTLIQIHRLGDDFKFLNKIKADVGEKADFRLMQVFISGGAIYADAQADLGARKSSFHADTGYLTTSNNELDINYVSAQSGELSMSDISVMGAMCDRSVKRFRGTIDFRQGAIGAKGDEIESVLLMDSDVVNKTVPIILCEEEDVEGNHGATIGKLDDDMLYYMKSRGMDEEAVRDMMKKAYVDAVLRRVPEEARSYCDKVRVEENLLRLDCGDK